MCEFAVRLITLQYSTVLTIVWGGEKTSLHPLGSVAGLRTKLASDRLIRKQQANLFNILQVHRSLQKENEDLKKLLGPKAYIFLHKKLNKLWVWDKTKQLELGQ